MNWKGFGRKHPLSNRNTILAFAWRDRKTVKNPIQDRWCPNQYSNQALPEFKSRALSLN
jgi:hypothetical protein